jgi:ABC-type nitrate/sulfonate/bicarbonate transport system permease component
MMVDGVGIITPLLIEVLKTLNIREWKLIVKMILGSIPK